MPPDSAAITALKSGDKHGVWPRVWRKALVPLAAAWVLIATLFASDWLKIADIAWNSSTFNHIVLVPLILVWPNFFFEVAERIVSGTQIALES
ncbi:MAG: hypothetical protein KUG65_10190 [Sphingomonadaceae bacterium]|nr:hypothetical protein [Sphingomonadaceae bacterium]